VLSQSRAPSALTGEASYEDRKLLRTTQFRTPYHAVPASPPFKSSTPF